MVVGMQQDTVYEMRVAARTAAGIGDYSASKTEKTKKWVATAAPVLNQAGSIAPLLTLSIAALLSAGI